MKKPFSALCCLGLILSTAFLFPACTPEDGYDDIYGLELRDTGPAVGLTFYVNEDADEDGWKYLEASPVDLTERAWGRLMCQTFADGTEIGTGADNTYQILTLDDSTPDKAADECADLIVNNGGEAYGDWFLPSDQELARMYQNLEAQHVGGFNSDLYWSSSEDGMNNALVRDFHNGDGSIIGKDNTWGVRAVRAF